MIRQSHAYFLFLIYSIFFGHVNGQAEGPTYTLLDGFNDYQTNNTCQYVRVNPLHPNNIHVVFQISSDSLDITGSRRTAYAFSSDGGLSWNDFSGITVPTFQSGYPTLDLSRGISPGSPVIADQFVADGDSRSGIFIGIPEGGDSFSEVSVPPDVSGDGDQPIFPDIACTPDSSIYIAATRLPVCGLYVLRHFPNGWGIGGFGGCISKYAVEANDKGYVGVMFVRDTVIKFAEKRGNETVWFPPESTIVLHPIVINSDTFKLAGSIDFTYWGKSPVAVFALKRIGFIDNDGAAIGFWSPATGIRLAVPRNHISGVVDSLNRPQVGHLSIGYPVIGVSGETLVIGFQAFRSDTSLQGLNFSDVFWSFSVDSGFSWASPMNLTKTPAVDERYPSISRWNKGSPSSVEANIVWQEDGIPGSHILDGVPVSRSRQVFSRVGIVWNDATEPLRQPNQFSLLQNYPNPFNPTTTIRYVTPKSSFVILLIYDLLGRVTAQIVNAQQEAGYHEVDVDGDNLPSGIYFYRLQAGDFVQTRKMVLLK